MKFLFFLGLLSNCLAAETTAILPAQAELRGLEARQQFIAEAAVNGHQEDRTRSVAWSSSNPAVATVDASGLVTPVSDGSVTISAGAAHASVRVTRTKDPFGWSFRNDVIPVLTSLRKLHPKGSFVRVTLTVA